MPPGFVRAARTSAWSTNTPTITYLSNPPPPPPPDEALTAGDGGRYCYWSTWRGAGPPGSLSRRAISCQTFSPLINDTFVSSSFSIAHASSRLATLPAVGGRGPDFTQTEEVWKRGEASCPIEDLGQEPWTGTHTLTHTQLRRGLIYHLCECRLWFINFLDK